MKPFTEDSTCLWVEAIKLRPTAERVLDALAVAENNPDGSRLDSTAKALAVATKLSPHVIRARLCDLRRLGLAHSYFSKRHRRSIHGLTTYGHRRQQHSR